VRSNRDPRLFTIHCLTPVSDRGIGVDDSSPDTA
jgi:hypothetical protein